VLEVLAESGYEYDSSVRLMLRNYAGEPWRQFPYRTTVAGRSFLEVPLSSIKLLGLHVPIAGGNYFRQFPPALVRRAVAHWDAHYPSPFVMYFHTWELDPDQPRINGVPLRQQVRQYRNLRKMPALIRGYLERYRFTSIAEYFDLASRPAPVEASFGGVGHVHAARTSQPSRQAAETLTGVTIVIPCFNEQQSLPYLANTLRSVTAELADRYRFDFVFIDDCSTDLTWQTLQSSFGTDPLCTLVRHEQNRGDSDGHSRGQVGHRLLDGL
jgi:hypothetical protein